MKLTIEIETGNDSLKDRDTEALSKVVRTVSDRLYNRIMDKDETSYDFVIRDSNGNRVGTATYA